MTRRPKMYRTTLGALAFILSVGVPAGATLGALPACGTYWLFPWWSPVFTTDDDIKKTTRGLDHRYYPHGLHHMNWD
jgi:hypothetical protein